MSEISWNGKDYTEDQFQQAFAIAANSPSSLGVTRQDWMKKLGVQYGGKRDIYEVLGYDETPEIDDLRARYERQDVANRVVSLPANECWKRPPVLSDDMQSEEDTEFETQFNRLEQRTNLFHYLKRADRISGIGRFGCLFIGFADSQPLEEPVDESALNGPDSVEFYSPFAEDNIEDWFLGRERELEPTDPRYNLPVEYNLNFADLDDEEDDIRKVHWTRVIHFAENRDESDIIGKSRLIKVLNRLVDLEKTVGSSAEIYWTSANPKYQFNVNADNSTDIPNDELRKMDEQVQQLVHEMSQYIKTFNTDIEVIRGEEVDPSGVVDNILKLISGGTGIPLRKLTGSERGELASTQDRANWYAVVEERQTQYVEPLVLRPVIQRFIDFGILPDPQSGVYDVYWPNLFELTAKEEAELWNERSQVLKNLAPQGQVDIIASYDELFEFIKEGKTPDFESAPEIASNEEVNEYFEHLSGS